MKIIVAQQNIENQRERIIFKPDSALVKSNKPFYIPEFSENITAQLFMVVKISKLGKNVGTKFAERYYSEIGLGICLTAKDLEENDNLSFCFDYSAYITDFFPKKMFDISELDFALKINKKTYTTIVKEWQTAVNELIVKTSKYCTLKIGDLIFFGNSGFEHKIDINDTLSVFLTDKKLIEINIK